MPVETDYDDIKARLHRYLISKTDFIKVKDTLNDDQMRMYVDRVITALSTESDIPIKFDDRVKDLLVFGALAQRLAHVDQQVRAVGRDELDERQEPVLFLAFVKFSIKFTMRHFSSLNS